MLYCIEIINFVQTLFLLLYVHSLASVLMEFRPCPSTFSRPYGLSLQCH